MRFLDQWQKVVHARNVEKGFYDYTKDIAQFKQFVERMVATGQTPAGNDGKMTNNEFWAVVRIVNDYERAMIERKMLLIIGELCEAHEELRTGHAPDEVYTNGDSPKPEGYGIEMADAEIRLLDLVASLGLDLETLMERKHAYNGTRPYKHGRQF